MTMPHTERRIVIVLKRLEDGKHQAQLRLAAGGNHLFFSRREGNTSRAKRTVEEMFGTLDWMEPPEALRHSEPGVNQVAYVNF